MDENTLKRVLDEALEPIKKKQDEHSKKLDSLWDQTTTLTEDVAEIKETLNNQNAASDKPNENITKLDKRVSTLEAHAGISTPPELIITE